MRAIQTVQLVTVGLTVLEDDEIAVDGPEADDNVDVESAESDVEVVLAAVVVYDAVPLDVLEWDAEAKETEEDEEAEDDNEETTEELADPVIDALLEAAVDDAEAEVEDGVAVVEGGFDAVHTPAHTQSRYAE